MISRQRRWQLRQEQAGRCSTCGRPASPDFKGLCLEHALVRRQAARERGACNGRYGFSDEPVNLRPRRVPTETCVAILLRSAYDSAAAWEVAVSRARQMLGQAGEAREAAEPGLVRFYL